MSSRSQRRGLPAGFHRHHTFASVPLAVLGALALGCTDTPTTFQPPDPQFAKPDCSADPSHPSCKDDGGGTTVSADLIDPTNDAPGIYSDGNGPYTGANVDGATLEPQCADPRSVSFEHVVFPAEVADGEDLYNNQSRCNDDGPQGGWVFLKAPGMLECDTDPSTDIPDCDFDLCPAYEKKGNRLIARGGFGNAARYFEEDTVTGEHLTFVFQDPSVVHNEDGSVTFRASVAHLYRASFLCVGDDDDGDTCGICEDIALSVDYTVHP